MKAWKQIKFAWNKACAKRGQIESKQLFENVSKYLWNVFERKENDILNLQRAEFSDS